MFWSAEHASLEACFGLEFILAVSQTLRNVFASLQFELSPCQLPCHSTWIKPLLARKNEAEGNCIGTPEYLALKNNSPEGRSWPNNKNKFDDAADTKTCKKRSLSTKSWWFSQNLLGKTDMPASLCHLLTILDWSLYLTNLRNSRVKRMNNVFFITGLRILRKPSWQTKRTVLNSLTLC